MEHQERELVHAAELEIAAGREPQGDARAAWLRAMQAMHHGANLDAMLRARVAEVRERSGQARADREAREREAKHRETAERIEREAVRGAAIAFADSLRESLAGVLEAKFPRQFGDARSWDSQRERFPTIIGPGDTEPSNADGENYVIVRAGRSATTFGAGFEDPRPAAEILVEVRSANDKIPFALLTISPREAESPIRAAVEAGGAKFGGVVQHGLRDIADRRDRRSGPDAGGVYGLRTKSGHVSVSSLFVVQLTAPAQRPAKFA